MVHLSIEGMDGIGKSTTCKLLAKRLGFFFVEKPVEKKQRKVLKNISEYVIR